MRNLFAFFCAFCILAEAQAQPAIKVQMYGRVETFEMSSAATGDLHSIQIYLPPGYDHNRRERFPLLVVLDGNILAPLAQGVINLFALEGSIRSPVLVGVGYPMDDVDAFFKTRMRYYTEVGGEPGNGSEAFARFLREELLPRVERDFRLDPTHRTLLATALPGLFGAYELFRVDTPFNNFIIGGPRLWWNEGEFFHHEATWAEQDRASPANVFTAVGTGDDARYVDSWRRFVALLEERAYPDLTVATKTYTGLSHFGAIAQTIVDGIRHVYGLPDEDGRSPP